MPTIVSQLDSAFRAAIRAAFAIDADPILTPAQNEKFGDYQSNAAMGLAKQVGGNPRAVAEQIKSKLDLGSLASEVSIAGPGFINIRLNPSYLAEQVKSIATDERLGLPLASSRQTVVVDYSGPNIAKQMHVGHLRSTIIGDSIARVLDFRGDEVIRQNHLGDWGTQFGMLIAHVKEPEFFIEEDNRWEPHVGQKPEHLLAIHDLEAFYREAKRRFDQQQGFAEKARASVVALQSGDPEARGWWQRIVEETRKHYQPLYERLNILLRTDDERGESFYNPMLPEIVRDLREKHFAEVSEGATVIFIDGPDKSPLIIEKTGGGYLYGTTDLAAIKYRVHERHADRIIYVTDARQSQHFQQVFAVAKRASYAGNASLEHAIFGTMLGEDGKPFKTRSGGTIKLKDLLDEAETRALALVTEKNPELPEQQRNEIAHAVGIGAVKYADLSKDRISDYVFSWDKALAMDGNTGPYLQYAYARIRSIFRKSGMTKAPDAPIALETPHELSLAKHVLRFGEIIDVVARELKPHHLTNYLYELATKFSGFYENCPVLQSEDPLRSSRLILSDVTARTLATGLDLLGIEHPEQM